jgi:capsular polysaccharide transport system ATP-binding protein
MIQIENVSKRYRTPKGWGKWVLEDINLTIERGRSVGLIGLNGQGKSTLIRLIAGIDQPSKGAIKSDCRISWPLGAVGGISGSLTGRQNTTFVCRLFGRETEIKDRIAFVRDFAELGPQFDEPVKDYSTGMKAKLRFAMSLAFDFDVYLVDELISVGDAVFRKKSAKAFKELAGRSSVIMASHDDKILLSYCQSGIWISEGKAHWFDDIRDALKTYRGSLKI